MKDLLESTFDIVLLLFSTHFIDTTVFPFFERFHSINKHVCQAYKYTYFWAQVSLNDKVIVSIMMEYSWTDVKQYTLNQQIANDHTHNLLLLRTFDIRSIHRRGWLWRWCWGVVSDNRCRWKYVCCWGWCHYDNP